MINDAPTGRNNTEKLLKGKIESKVLEDLICSNRFNADTEEFEALPGATFQLTQRKDDSTVTYLTRQNKKVTMTTDSSWNAPVQFILDTHGFKIMVSK